MVHWGCRLIGVTDGINTASKGHKLQAGMKGLMNDIFLDDLRERTHRGMVGQALKGYHCGGRAYGYVLVPEHHPTKLDPYGQPTRIGTRLEQHSEQAAVVRWIFECFEKRAEPSMKIVEVAGLSVGVAPVEGRLARYGGPAIVSRPPRPHHRIQAEPRRNTTSTKPSRLDVRATWPRYK